MMRCTQTLILFLALLLTSCTAPARSLAPTAETRATAVATFTGTPSPTPTATVIVAISVSGTATATPTAAVTRITATRVPTLRPSPAPPTATATHEPPSVTLTANANLRAGPGTAYPVIGSARAGQTLVVTGRANGSVGGQPVTWWGTARGWVAGSLVTANAATLTVPVVTDVPPPPTPTDPPPTVLPTPAPPPHNSGAAMPDLVVLGSDTQYPVRARVVHGWDYEFVDLSTQYDIVVYRDVFGMLAHQIDDDNVQHYSRTSRFVEYGPIRITLIDAQPHPDPNCPGWGWAPDRDTFVDPFGMTRNPCRIEHSLFPTGDGVGTTLLLGWGYSAGTTLAVGAAGLTLADLSTTVIADALPRPRSIRNNPPDYSQPLYQPLGQAYREGDRWGWHDPFVQIVPVGR